MSKSLQKVLEQEVFFWRMKSLVLEGQVQQTETTTAEKQEKREKKKEGVSLGNVGSWSAVQALNQ